MTTRIPISTDDRPLGSRELSAVIFALSISVIAAVLMGTFVVGNSTGWEPLRTGDYHSLTGLLLQALGCSAIAFVFLWPGWVGTLAFWVDESRLSVHVDTAQGNLVIQTTRLFGYRRIVRISLADVQSVAVRTIHSENDQNKVKRHQVLAFCKGTRPPVLIANLGPARLAEAEAIAQRLRDALSAAYCGFPQGETVPARG
jgi:hypothetical protein